LARDTGQIERAGVLWGAVEAGEAARPGIVWAIDRVPWEAAVVAGTDREFDSARERGHALALDEAVQYALAPRD
jgi:hypothetical protein